MTGNQTADDFTDEAIPRPSAWYARYPFDPSLVAFQYSNGEDGYFMRSALDEAYLAEPDDHGSYILGTIPPEEREVRDTLLATVYLRDEVSRIDFWWSQFVRPTKAYRASLECFQKLSALCAKSREYRAAFCRLASSEGVPPSLRRELKRIVFMCDNAKHD